MPSRYQPHGAIRLLDPYGDPIVGNVDLCDSLTASLRCLVAPSMLSYASTHD